MAAAQDVDAEQQKLLAKRAAEADAYRKLAEAVGECVSMAAAYRPNFTEQERYEAKYGLYRKLYPTLVDLNRRITR